MAYVRGGPRSISAETDTDGHRTHKVKWLVISTWSEGTFDIMRAAGLPLPGSPWIWGVVPDLEATRRLEMGIKIHDEKEGERTRFWIVEQTFSTKPAENKNSNNNNRQGCADQDIKNPLMQPAKISGNAVQYTEEATEDRFRQSITNSSHEQLRGAQIEFDLHRHQIKIEQNVVDLQMPLITALLDTVNDRAMWGVPRRCVKLSDWSWSDAYYGTCLRYFTRTLVFDIWAKRVWIPRKKLWRTKSGFDRDLLDEGSKVLNGKWDPKTRVWTLVNINGQPPNRMDPSHFIRSIDFQGNPIRIVLDGHGKPATCVAAANNMFLSILAANTGNKLSNPAAWIPLNMMGSEPGQPMNPPEWDEDTVYSRGAIVSFNGTYWVALVDKPAPNAIGTDWINLGAISLGYAGAYNPATTYHLADYVDGTDTTINMIGHIHVEKYEESNLSQLNLPVNL